MEQENLVDKDQQLSLKLFIVLTRALEAIQKQIIKDIKNYNLNLSEFSVLELLYHKGDQPIQKIGQKVLLASSSITYVIDKLEEKKYIKRKACPKDRRVTYAVITDEGKNFMDGIFPKHKKAISQIMAGLSTEEKATMIPQLKKLGLYAQNL
ncbi:MarR family winged helix-turn-helix transcriptional regulator [Bacillus kwashiorkori]|uniref:MarR family winged helix-turn-helix transcriptional regulator n=1 Tax=Bacillus kwashiorkori TaxID=1522318 RepID=UPI0007806997|nr:MarR family transcriptional regulator [Bacillus kwashiorkori]